MVECLVGAAILVYHRAAMAQSQNCCDGNCILADQTDFHVESHAANHVPEPYAGLREQLVTPPGDHEESVEVIENFFRASFLVGKLLALGSTDAALDTVFVQIAENLLDGRCQAESMEPEGLARCQRRARGGLPDEWPKLDVFPALSTTLRSHPFCEL